MRQLILHRISPSIYMYMFVCVCVSVSHFRNAINMCYSAMCNSSYVRHTPSQVSAYMQRVCTYGHRCSNRMNSDDSVRHLTTLRKRKQREKDCSDSKRLHELQLWETSPSTYLLATASTINFHMLSQSLFHFHTI